MSTFGEVRDRSKSSVANSKSAAPQDPVDVMAMESTKMERRIEVERRRLEHIKHEIAAAEERLLKARKNIGGVYRQVSNERAIVRQRKKLEGDLANANSRLNTTLSSNERICSEISDLRREKVGILDRCEKLVRKIEGEHAKIQQVQASTDELSRAHNLITAEISAIKFTEQEEVAMFAQEMRNLDQEIINTKSAMTRFAQQSAGNPSLFASGVAGSAMDGDDIADTSIMGVSPRAVAFGASVSASSTRMFEDPRAMLGKAGRGRWKNTTLLRHIEILRRSTKQMQANYDRIKQQTGVNDFEEFVSKVEASGQRAATAYSMANQLSKELRVAEEERDQLAAQLEVQMERVSSEVERQRQITATQAGVLAKWKTDHEAIEAELAKRQAGVDATKEVLRRIFASDPQHSTTFAPGTVDNSDIPGILSTIELRVQNILRVYEQLVGPLAPTKAAMAGTASAILGNSSASGVAGFNAFGNTVFSHTGGAHASGSAAGGSVYAAGRKRPLRIKPPGVDDVEDELEMGSGGSGGDDGDGFGDRDDDVVPLSGDRLKAASISQYEARAEKMRSKKSEAAAAAAAAASTGGGGNLSPQKKSQGSSFRQSAAGSFKQGGGSGNGKSHGNSFNGVSL